MLLRRLALVLASVGVLAGAALAANGEPVERHTAADMAKARSILIKRADLGAGWTRDTSPTPDEDCEAFDPDESALVETGEADALFERGTSLIGSEVVVYRTEAMARSSWAIGAKLALMNCFLEGLRAGLPPDIRLSVVRRATVSFAAVAPRTVAFTLAVRLVGPNGTVVMNVDVVAVGRGRAIAALATVAVGERVPLAERQRLARLLARRMA